MCNIIPSQEFHKKQYIKQTNIPGVQLHNIWVLAFD